MPYMLFTITEGRHVGKNPLLTAYSDSERTNPSPPSMYEWWTEWVSCGQRLCNKDTLGFVDPTVEECWDVTKHYLRAAIWKHEDSMEYVLRRRRFAVDPKRTPWAPKPEYVELLKRQQRLLETNSTMPASPSALDAKDLLEDALKGHAVSKSGTRST